MRSGRNSSIRKAHALHDVAGARSGPELDLPAASRRVRRDQLPPFEVAGLAGLELGFDEDFSVRLLEADEQAAAA